MRRLFFREGSPRTAVEPYEPPPDDVLEGTGDEQSHTRARPIADHQAARRVARERFQLIAAALKREAGIRRHYTHKSISGLAWIGARKILAPDGITRRQLYVLAHECGHIVLHSSPSTWGKPGHVKEHEAETYAHRAFVRYGLEVPEKSAQWARTYIGHWIMKDRAAGIPICPMAEAFATGQREPLEPLPAVDGHPKSDFSKMLERHTAKSLRIAARQDAVPAQADPEPAMVVMADAPPNACGTCRYLRRREPYHVQYHCAAFLVETKYARNDVNLCNGGAGWRPSHSSLSRGLLSRIGHGIIDRMIGRRF